MDLDCLARNATGADHRVAHLQHPGISRLARGVVAVLHPLGRHGIGQRAGIFTARGERIPGGLGLPALSVEPVRQRHPRGEEGFRPGIVARRGGLAHRRIGFVDLADRPAH